MKSLLIASTLALAALTAPAAHAGDVGVSISVGQPGFYGQIQLGGGYPPPTVVYTEPVLVERVYAPPPPIYLRVPPAHYAHWARHCGFYRACGRPVYFVREDWYARTYAPAYYGPEYYGPAYSGPAHHGPAYRPGFVPGPAHGYPMVAPPPRWEGRRDWDRRDWDRRDWDRRDWDRRDWDRRGDGRRDGRGDGRWDGRRDWDDRRADDHHPHRDH
jgi:hypothetical protein